MNPLLRIYSPGNLRTLGRDRCGAASIESSLISALMAVVIIAAVGELGSKFYQFFDSTAQLIEQAACGPGNGNGNCGNSGNGGGNTGGSGPGSGNGGSNNGQGNGSGNGGGGNGNGGGSGG